MELININYIFSAGFRCYSPDFLIFYNLRPFSGPFDYLFIDIETVFKLIYKKMDNFLNNIVIFNKSSNITYELNILNELNNKYVCYMAHDYNNYDIRINTNYIDKELSGNLYEWNSICIFHHHDIYDSSIYNTIIKRVERFKNIIKNNSQNTCLFHITKILHINNITEYIDSMINMKNKYQIDTYIIIIMCCDNLEDNHYFKDNILFIIKKVDSYDIQINSNIGTDNNLDYGKELQIIKQYFNFNLVQKDKI